MANEDSTGSAPITASQFYIQPATTAQCPRCGHKRLSTEVDAKDLKDDTILTCEKCGERCLTEQAMKAGRVPPVRGSIKSGAS
jgi:DNA-directed RNA polymerase subunit RPC12/RpoP